MPAVQHTVGGMAPKPLPSEEETPAQAVGAAVSASGKEAPSAVKPAGDKPAPAPEDELDDDLELEMDDEDDEDLVVFTAQEAAGAFSTISNFVGPYLGNYKKLMIFVSFGIMVETLFNVIMPLSLKFLIDDALGEEDFQALYKILGVLAAASIFTSIIAIWYERWDAKLVAGIISDVRT